MHSHDSGFTTHEHRGGNFPHRHEDPANLARIELLTNPDPGFVPEPILDWEPTPAPTPNPAPAPPVESDYDRQYRLITEEGNMWKWISIAFGVVAIVALVFVALLAANIIGDTVVTTPTDTTVVDASPAGTDKVVATDQGITVEQMVEAMKQAGFVPASPTADNGNTSNGQPAQPAQDQSVQGSSQIGSVNDAPSYGNDPETYVPHPLSYQETGIQGTVSWKIEVLSETTLIVGGWSVDNQDGGVYKAIHGPKTVSVKVADGFYSVVPDEWAQSEWDFRIGEAVKYGWAHAHETPPTW